tara:strand:+ start:353 stop:688 length:336 start_codon:yes stop_codon:yes gene_type:complete
VYTINIVRYNHVTRFPDKYTANRLITTKNVIKVFDETRDLFFIKRNNVIGKKGGIKFAARCDPQNKNESRLKKIISVLGLLLPEKPNIFDIKSGKTNSIIPRNAITETAIE